MAALHGKEGKIVTGAGASTVTLMNEWNMNIDLPAEEITDFGDDWEALIAGIGSWSGDMKGSYDPSDTTGQKAIQDLILAASPAGASTNTLLYVSAANYISGNIIITGLSIGTPVKGVVTIGITFRGNGAPSYN